MACQRLLPVGLNAALLAWSIVMLGTSAEAQTTDPAQMSDSEPTTDPAQASVTPGEIIVTAQRRSERLRDVPMSVAAISADSLAKSGVTNSSDIARLVPSVVMPFQGAFLQPSIRGVSSTGAAVGDNANVAMYIDGVYQPQQIATLVDLADVQQIEVLKGPQGALYGQNATGGAILITTMAPSFTESGRFSASYGNYNAVSVRGFVTGPVLGNTIAASLAGGIQNRDGFRRHIITGQRDQGLNSKVLRGKLLFVTSDTARITITGYYSDRADSSQYAGFAIDDNSVGYALVPTAPKATSPNQFTTDPEAFSAIVSYGGNIRGAFETDDGTINTTTSYSRNKVSYLADLDFSPVDYASTGAKNAIGQYFIQEANFVSRKFGKISFLVGGFYLNGSEYGYKSDFTLTSPTLPPTPPGAILLRQEYRQRLDKTVFAAYGDITFKATDRLTLTAGGRYTHEQQRVFSNSAPSPNEATVVERPDGPANFSNFSPRFTARYEVTPESNIYGSLSKGFKSGILNPNTLTQAPVRPETITAYEIGYKGNISHAVKLDVAAFLYDYTNLQVVSYVAPLYLQQNAASARIKGIDIDGSWAVTRNLQLTASASFLHARYRKFPNAQIFVSNGFGSDAVTADLSGKQMLRAPKFSGNIGANYHLETAAGQFGAYASVYHNSGFGFEVSNRLRTGVYTTVDGELSFAPNALQGVRFVLWAKNLGDKAYLASALASPFADGGSYAEPRTYGIRVEYAF